MTQLSPVLPHIDAEEPPEVKKDIDTDRLPESKHDKERLEVELEGLKKENEHMKAARGELRYEVEE